jgi:hypothetical protein
MIDETGGIECLDEHGGAAVHDRHFAAIQFDVDIVDAERVERGHKVLDGRDRAIRRLAKQRAEIRGTDLRRDSANADHITVGKLAVEDDAVVGISGMKRDRDVFTGMDSDARQRNRPRNCGLQSYYITTHKVRRFPQYLAWSVKTMMSPIVRSSPTLPQCGRLPQPLVVGGQDTAMGPSFQITLFFHLLRNRNAKTI